MTSLTNDIRYHELRLVLFIRVFYLDNRLVLLRFFENVRRVRTKIKFNVSFLLVIDMHKGSSKKRESGGAVEIKKKIISFFLFRY